MASGPKGPQIGEGEWPPVYWTETHLLAGPLAAGPCLSGPPLPSPTISPILLLNLSSQVKGTCRPGGGGVSRRGPPSQSAACLEPLGGVGGSEE